MCKREVYGRQRRGKDILTDGNMFTILHSD